MNADFIDLTAENIDAEHICCAFSDKKCAKGYELKKQWLKSRFAEGYKFRRLDARAKVFLEYCPAETGTAPVDAPGYLLLNCFWVSGKYKGKGYASTLLQSAVDDACSQDKNGLVTVAGIKKFHFLSDAKWLLNRGFEIVDKTDSGFGLLALKLKPEADDPKFKACAVKGECPDKEGITVYYSNRCPYAEYYVDEMLKETAVKRNLKLNIIKIETVEQAQSSPSPSTVFGIFVNGKFVTSDISACMDSRFDKIVKL